MRTHQEIDQRSLALAQMVVARIDADPARRGLQQARATCERWQRQNPTPVLAEWMAILQGDWAAVRDVLLAPTAEGQRLRQSSPFCGVLTPQERWSIYHRYCREQNAA